MGDEEEGEEDEYGEEEEGQNSAPDKSNGEEDNDRNLRRSTIMAHGGVGDGLETGQNELHQVLENRNLPNPNASPDKLNR